MQQDRMTKPAVDLPLLTVLVDGRFHSGEQLAAQLGISRAAVWKRVRRLQQTLGLSVDAVRGRGYRLAAPIELLDADLIRSLLSSGSRRQLAELALLPSVASTNDLAMAASPPLPGAAKVWLAEHQSAGRGRRGRQWVSVFGASLYLSIAWVFDRPMSAIAGLSLVAGIAVAETLERLGVTGIALKWPNDVVVDGRKLSGILVEASGEANGPATAVVGVGLNVHLPAAVGRTIDQPWIDLRSLGLSGVGRNALAAALIDALIDSCARYARHPLADFLPRWRRYDALCDRMVQLNVSGTLREGRYLGVATSGAVRIETSAGLEEHLAGEVSLRYAGA
jgi:BirA family biotin operon repressor/biotin-[acetyl-CoA-carboxylase] ligase